MNESVAPYQRTAGQAPPVVFDWPPCSRYLEGQQGVQPLASSVRHAFSIQDTETGVPGLSAGRLQTQPRRRWGDPCVSVLLANYPTSIPVIDIALRLGRSKGSIYGKARRLGLRRPMRQSKRPEPVGLENECKPATADEIPNRRISADNPVAVTEAIVVQDEEEKPELPPPLIPIDQTDVALPRPYVRTKLEGRLTVWFPELVERMMRLWLANVHHTVIAQVLGPEMTGGAVQRKAHRVGMLPRHGLTLIMDLAVAQEIDRQAAPLPRVIRDHRGKPWHLRICGGSEVACYRPNTSRLSPQAMETKWYQEGRSVMF